MYRLLMALVPLALEAAMIRGVVIDHYSGRPIARALVTLESLPGYASVQVASRTGMQGQFTFSPLPAGAYLLTVSRRGYATLKHGQKNWNAPAVPIPLQPESAPYLDLRLRRLGAIAGTVWDENEIGYPDMDVFAYRPTRPPTLVARSKTDERGVYRIGSLLPGEYLVRTGPQQLEDGAGLIPTFYKDAATVEQSRPATVNLEEQTPEVNIRPFYGRLFRIRGKIYGEPLPAQLTLSSDMGRITASSSGAFSFEHLAPGNYELVAEATGPGTSRLTRPAGYYTRLVVDRDLELTVDLKTAPMAQFVFEDREGGRFDPSSIKLLARRKDLAGEGPAQTLPAEPFTMGIGRWELSVVTPPHLYPVSILGTPEARRNRADGWTEIMVAPYALQTRRVRVSSKPAAVRGRVLGSGREPVIGAPVFLEPLDEQGVRRILEPRVTRTDAQGAYSFAGLPPGHYRLLSTFEFEDPDESTMALAAPKSIVVKESEQASQDLDLYVRP